MKKEAVKNQLSHKKLLSGLNYQSGSLLLYQ